MYKPSRATLRPACLIAALLLSAALPAQDAPQQPLGRVENVLAVQNSGIPVDIQGVVVEVYWAKGFMVRDDSGIIAVRLKPGQQDAAKLQRGDLVGVTGTTLTDETLRTVVDASDVKVISRAKGATASTRAANIAAVHAGTRVGDVVTVIGQINSQNADLLEIKDKTGTITVSLGDAYRRKTLKKDAYVVVAGEVGESLSGLQSTKIIRALAVAEVQDPRGLEVPPEVRGKVKDLKLALGGVKAGEEIVARGRVIKYIGDKVRDVLFDGENSLVIDPEDPNGPQIATGEEVIVKGTLDFVEFQGRQVPVVRHAKVMKEMKTGVK